jgi:PAS domain S-box-containing protein
VGRTLEQVLGRTDADFMGDPIAAARLMASDRQVIATGQPIEHEEPVVAADGQLRYWLTRKRPLRDEAGAVVGVLGIARDITRRRQAEKRRDADRLKLQMGIEAAGLVMADIDYRTNENHISGELAQLLELGDGPMTVPRQAIFDRIHPQDRERYLRAIAETTDPHGTGHLAIDVRALLPSGTVRWLHIRLQVIFSELDGRMQPDRGICAARDVTAEMVAEGKLRAAQRLTESVIEGAGALVYAKDLQGRYILSNQAWRAVHGMHSAEEATGTTDEQLFGPELAAPVRENDRRVAETGQPLLVQERSTSGGREVTYRSSKFPLYDEAGHIYAVCGVSTDISDVVEADRRKDEFIATLAHELRNPLAPIRTGLEILRRAGELPPMAQRTRDMMERQLTHLVRLVDDLLDVSRINRDKLELRLAPLAIDEVVAHAVEASRPGVEAAGHRISVQLPAPPLRIRGDLTRLAQVLGNLVNNAAKYTPAGGHIRISAEAQGDEVLLHVADDGIGVDPAMLPRLFELFLQGDGAARKAQGGLGIGLWLVRKLVALHGGSVRAHSAGPGQGSTFTVCLPRLRD